MPLKVGLGLETRRKGFELSQVFQKVQFSIRGHQLSSSCHRQSADSKTLALLQAALPCVFFSSFKQGLLCAAEKKSRIKKKTQRAARVA